ncbi:protein NUCLEAR FUSION DEFECTIVE 4-like [Olea europaea var. sylvestris]|uniref:NUCLEAR FUSION DEFECTIVE 4-like n=1 Tax=Olea europaea subsp. europaea TaxID=158383 RepID=A0A8S0RW21_OLEEU|nr:protein NUCLEAR FUSION DEFECTIVE 4-like [Olea europaea var. sylvestris]CAA2983544.1 NUCLEAR FUSION DEFECTIVE 4-like [Olea europaea subsp. europaea]
MAGHSRKWMILVATIWIQAFTGTNFDFSAYSSELKSVLGISQVQLNYLATASDLGKALGWSSGLALIYLPLWMVMLLAAAMGLIGYGVQWLVIRNIVALPYFVVFLLCLLAGCSICWFNTVCFVLCIKNFPCTRPLALALTVSFNGVSAALYNLAAKSLNPSSTKLYLLLNAIIPLFTSIAAVIPILCQPPADPLSPDAVKHEQLTFLKLNLLAIITGLYLLFLHSSNASIARFLFVGAIFLLILPLAIPGIIYARDWFKHTIYRRFQFEGSGFMLVDADDLELHKELLSRENSVANGLIYTANNENSVREMSRQNTGGGEGCSCYTVIGQDQLFMLGEEHKAKMLISRIDFWLYYLAYFCGGTIGLVYSNNLGQIAQSLGQSSTTSRLITMYSSFSFFGRLLSATPDFIRRKFYFARTGWLVIALLPTPIAFFLLAATGTEMALQAGTALIGLSSGFIFAAAVSITSELFGPNSVGVNHNILITNIPIGSLVYGFLAATFYDSNAESRPGLMTDSMVCMGRKCYFSTFIWWGSISILGIASSLILFLRTRLAYDRFERNRLSTILD